jgi:hypothetical protein
VSGGFPFAIEAFSCPKAGNRPEEYEDAWAFRTEGAAGRARVAVADGATESSFSKLWAVLLVESWVRGRAEGPEALSRLEGARRLWRRKVVGRKLPWYAAEKASRGAHAAFVGLALDPAERRWRAAAVGDCCLFELHGVGPGLRLARAFPLTRSEEFGSSPFLVGSIARGGEDPSSHLRLAEGSLPHHGTLLFASDALSAWLLAREERGEPAWEAASRLGVADAVDFEALVARAREEGARNDDMTLLRLTSLPD